MWGQWGSQSSLRLSLFLSHILPCFPNLSLCSLHLVSFRHPYIALMKSDFGIFPVLWIHFLHIYSLVFYLKKISLPSKFEKILWNNKFLKIFTCRVMFLFKTKMTFASCETLNFESWLHNLSILCFGIL